MYFREIVNLVKERKKNTCREWDRNKNLEKKFIKCFELSDDLEIMTNKCRPNMQEAREMY